MSHAYGKVYRLSNRSLIGHFEYNGTCDCACSAIFPTQEELTSAWRSDAIHRECACADSTIVDVWLSADYGGGVEFASKACTRCMTIVGHLEDHCNRGWWY